MCLHYWCYLLRSVYFDMRKLLVTGVVGKMGELSWSQAQTRKIGENGGRWIILTMQKPPEAGLLDLGEVGSEILREWADAENRIESVEQAKIENEKLLSDISENIVVEVVQGDWEGDEIRMWGKGGGGAYLYREGKIAKLGKESEGIWWSKGELQAGDRVLLVNEKWGKELGVGGINDLLTDEKLTELLPLKIQETEVGGLAGVALELVAEKANKNSLWGKWGREKAIRIKQDSAPRRRMGMWVGGIVFVTLIFMIGLGVVRREQTQQQNNYNQMEESVRAKITEAEMAVEADPGRVSELLKEAKKKAEEYLATAPKESYKTKAVKLVAEIEQAEERLFKKNEVNLTTVVELSVLEKNLVSTQMRTDGKNNLLWLDTSTPRVIAMNINDRSKQEITGTNLSTGRSIASSENEVFWLADEGVWTTSWKDKKFEREIVPDEFWQDPQIVDVFAGNVYVFDKSQSEIWKYPVLSDGYGSRRRWLAAGITPDLSKVIQMKVTGDIWLLTETGKIVRYNRGSLSNFALEGYPYTGNEEVLDHPKAMYVGENSVYIAENGAKRIVAVTTEGKFEAQYLNSEFEQIDDMVVVDDKIYVLTNNVVKEFGL